MSKNMKKFEINNQKQTFFRLVSIIGVLAILAFGISSCNLPSLADLLGSDNATGIPDPNTPSPTPSPSETPLIPAAPSRTLIVWVPPQFDPNSGTTAGNLFLSRIEEFITRRPQTEIQVRVKPLEGEYGLVESLRVTGSAAPIIQPDLIALPRPLMEQAFREGLIMSLDDLAVEISDNGWFDYAQDLAKLDGSTIGLPFAGDLLTLAYISENEESPPQDWNTLLAYQKAMAFPASDNSGLITLAFYQSLGGELIDESGAYILDGDKMLETLTFYQRAQAAGVMPYWLTQFETEEQAWLSFQDRQSTMALSWSSVILGTDTSNTSLAALPTENGKAFSYADGWVWCLVHSSPANENEAFELAEFLTAESYLSTWGPQTGYLPVQSGALINWSETPYYAILQQILPAAVLVPENSLIAELGTDIKNAVIAVLKDQVEPIDALDVLLDTMPAP
jgi:ABC-type glycerol-3-phosphate transport system substrate-binding protein